MYQKLVDIIPYKFDDTFYLKLIYEYTDNKGKHSLIYPKVSFPLPQTFLPVLKNTGPFDPTSAYLDPPYLLPYQDKMYLLPGTSKLAAKKGATQTAYAFDIITEPAEPKSMTVEEIEEKLGYKIQIVSKEDNKNGSC